MKKEVRGRKTYGWGQRDQGGGRKEGEERERVKRGGKEGGGKVKEEEREGVS